MCTGVQTRWLGAQQPTARCPQPLGRKQLGIKQSAASGHTSRRGNEMILWFVEIMLHCGWMCVCVCVCDVLLITCIVYGWDRQRYRISAHSVRSCADELERVSSCVSAGVYAWSVGAFPRLTWAPPPEPNRQHTNAHKLPDVVRINCEIFSATEIQTNTHTSRTDRDEDKDEPKSLPRAWWSTLKT